jgi:hypothetical protein
MKGYTCTAARYIGVTLKESSDRKVGEEKAMNSAEQLLYVYEYYDEKGSS